MNTLDDLHHTFDVHAAQAPDGHGLLDGARAGAARRRVRRRWQSLIAGLAVVAVAGTTPLLAGALRHDAPPEPLPPRIATRTTLGLAEGSPFAVVGQSSSQGWETIEVNSPGGNLTNAVHVIVRRSSAGNLMSGERLTVGGHDAWFTTDYRGAEVLPGTLGPVAMLGWPLPSGEWVKVTGGDRDALLRVAGQVTMGAPRPVLTPFRTGWLPAGFVTYRISQDARSVVAQYQPAGLPEPDSPHRSALAIEMWKLPGSEWPRQRQDLWRPVTGAGGRPTYERKQSPEDADTLAVETPTCVVHIRMRGATRAADLRRVAENLTIADCTDRKTWSPAGS